MVSSAKQVGAGKSQIPPVKHFLRNFTGQANINKFQITSSKHQINPKLQAPNSPDKIGKKISGEK